MGATKFLSFAILLSVCFGQVHGQDFSTNFSWINTIGASTSSTTVNACDTQIGITPTTGTGHVPFSSTEVVIPIGSSKNSIDTVIGIQLTFSQPVTNLQLKLRDLDVGDYNTPPSEYLNNFSLPLPSSIAPVPGSLTFILNPSHTTINPGNQRDTDGWIEWSGAQSSISFDYHRLGGQGIRLDSIKFDCPCVSGPVDLITRTTDYSVCSAMRVIPDLSEVLAGNTYQWIPTTGLSNPTILNPTITVNQSTDYMVIATDNCGFMDTLLVSIEVGSINELDIDGASEITVCPGEATNPELGVILSENSFSWQPTAGLSDPTILNPEITTTEAITYILTASNPCAADATFELFVEIADPLDFELDPEITICKGDTIELPGFLNSSGDINWNNTTTLSDLDIPSPLAFPSSTTEYIVTVSNACETQNESINVIVLDAPSISGEDQLNICAGDTAYANIHNTGNTDVAT